VDLSVCQNCAGIFNLTVERLPEAEAEKTQAGIQPLLEMKMSQDKKTNQL
jgi:hypothetical protein